MSDAYEDDLAAEEAIFAAIAASEVEPETLIEAARPKGGRPTKVNPIKLVAWNQAHRASISATARRGNVSPATVKRYVRDYEEAAKAERRRWECDRLDRELREHQHGLCMIYLRLRNQHLRWADFGWPSQIEAAIGTEREAGLVEARAAAMEKAAQEFDVVWARDFGPVPSIDGDCPSS